MHNIACLTQHRRHDDDPLLPGSDTAIIMKRMSNLMACLLKGHIHRAKSLCQLNFKP